MNLKVFIFTVLASIGIPNVNHAQFNSVLDFSYNKINNESSPLLSLDIYAPTTGDNFPVVVFVHGGGWQIGDKASVTHINKRNFFVDNGFIFVSVNYRLAPGVFYPVYPQDVAQSLAFVLKWIGKFKGDSQNVFLMGHSAGAHLAALVATDDSYLNQLGYDTSDIKAVILLDGAGYDIPAFIDIQTRNNNTDAVAMYHTAFGTELNTWQEASPATYVTQTPIPPIQLFYVDTRVISRLMSTAFSNKLLSNGHSVELIAVPNSSHADINTNFGLPDDNVSQQALNFILRNMTFSTL